jgi:hypothetical protein
VQTRFVLVIASAISTVAVACGPTIDVGRQDAGPGSTPDGGGAPLSSAAMNSPYLAKCKVACAPPSSGPCQSADVNTCLESCTAVAGGLTVGCAQCVIEQSRYTGSQCVDSPCGARCPKVTCSYPDCLQSTCGGTSGSPPPACDPACLPSDEKCDGFKLAKTTDSSCTALCK